MNAALVEEIRQRYEVDPSSVHSSWAEFFEKPETAAPAPPPPPAEPAPAEPARGEMAAQLADKHARVLRLIHSYRARGHRIADTDPLGGQSLYFPELDPAHYGFGNDDLDRPYIAGDLPGGSVQTLRQILERLRATYCRKVGVEFTHIQDPGRKAWLQRRLEDTSNTHAVLDGRAPARARDASRPRSSSSASCTPSSSGRSASRSRAPNR